MGLEAVMVVVDNSESSRNGDYQPTRFDAQADAVSTLFQTITNGNPESSVGLMSMGGKGPEVLVTLTTEHGKVLEGLHRTKKKLGGSSHLKTSIQVAALALKHRQNRSQRQRIIVFVCSPIADEQKELVQLAKKMKKGNTTVDFVLFGELEDEETQKKLEAFNEAVKNNDGSHLVVFPPSSKLLGDQLVSSPILLGDNADGAGGGEGGGANEEFEFGIDPSLEPELALALRMSMEEEKARQEKKAKEEEEAARKASLADVKEEDEAGPSGSGDAKDDGKKDSGDKMDTS
ncbi:26S proteasome non-ATPase regulatory subunit-like protein [Hapsidospora chrysogenum ATCC 11550]|uniref:26S proteasome non-ATPase regulatory subunit-like protein n=1 Tax=Hapsidospora chrysogenum (strain ATCC 11550 / CBS 779.69 / DSM 880 / IAM 14645 / JCM 23072 / IMI 49137) TaxID=857340 RepID=A0A086T2M0_HAPC1|nr:26S proteasome non-ATPase regulatory subunit-like protein [Hapsidospora chrysogenum ATCC 11550]